MNPKKRFILGGGGALMPVLVSFLAIDIAAVIDTEVNLSMGNVVGFGIRYVILFAIGGLVAYLHDDELKPFKLFELGVAAPALITSFITAQGVSANLSPIVPPPSPMPVSFQSLAIVSSAHAQGSSTRDGELVVAQGSFFSDVFRGIGGGVYRDIAQQQKAEPPGQQIDERSEATTREADSTSQAEEARSVTVKPEPSGSLINEPE